jgi:hypothetical protein
VAGTGDELALGALLAHARGCEACRRVLELHRDLLALGSSAPDPPGAELEAARAAVLRQVGRPVPRGRHVPVGVAAALAGAVVVVFAAGFGAGRARSAPGLAAAISAEAAANRDLADVEDSPFTVSNVAFRRAGEGRVELEFDVTTHLRLVEPVASEVVREVLVHSLVHPSSVGTRLEAMSYVTGGLEPKVRDGLLFAVRNDDNLAVRLEALGILCREPATPALRDAVLEVLREDASVEMRLRALDWLASHRTDRERLERAIDGGSPDGGQALRVRLAEYADSL